MVRLFETCEEQSSTEAVSGAQDGSMGDLQEQTHTDIRLESLSGNVAVQVVILPKGNMSGDLQQSHKTSLSHGKAPDRCRCLLSGRNLGSLYR